MSEAKPWSAHDLGSGMLLEHPTVTKDRVGKLVHILRRLDGWRPGEMPYFEVRVSGEEPQRGSVYPAYPGSAIGEYIAPAPFVFVRERDKPMKVGDLRRLLEGVPDDQDVVVRTQNSDGEEYCGSPVSAATEEGCADAPYFAIDCRPEEDL